MMNYCPNCGTSAADNQRFCSNCGFSYDNPAAQPQNTEPEQAAPVSPKSRLATLLLCFFVGEFGVHRFYVGKTGTGVLWLLTLGCFGIGALVDLIMIACGSFKDSDELPITDWQI